jgi:uncharacterized protein YcbK (DUF882 family)
VQGANSCCNNQEISAIIKLQACIGGFPAKAASSFLEEVVRVMAMAWVRKIRLRHQSGSTALLLLATLVVPSRTALTTTPPAREYHLRLYETHTRERLDVVYRRGDSYLPGALAKLDHLLRDHRTGDVHHFDPRLFDLLADLTASVGHPATEIDVVCGYRSPWSNEYLREHTTGVAKNSLHMQAEAIDIRLPAVKTLTLRNAALALHRGGVGYYPQSNFVHVDVGRVRRW